MIAQEDFSVKPALTCASPPNRSSFRSSQLMSFRNSVKLASGQSEEFRIMNPLASTPIYQQNNTFTPKVPRNIQQQLSEVDYLTFEVVNNIGKENCPQKFDTCIDTQRLQGNSTQPKHIEHPLNNRRTSRFSIRLQAMQKALKAQSNKVQSLQAGGPNRSSFRNSGFARGRNSINNENGYYSGFFNEIQNPINASNSSFFCIENDVETNLMMSLEPTQDQHFRYCGQFCCEEENETQGEEFQKGWMGMEIDEQEYESYLNV